MSYIYLTLITDWIGIVISFIALLLGMIGAFPVIKQWLKNKKYSKESAALIEEQERKFKVIPNFEVYASLIVTKGKWIQLINKGGRATSISLISHGSIISPLLKTDKGDVDTNEAVMIFFGDNFKLHLGEILQVHIGFNDVDHRRYQQTYVRDFNSESLSLPQLLQTYQTTKK